ncbi:MAG: hypothetical protein JNL32_06215 [Candidatus Kapabacteria bacterium]|nr:hypothetical protein [Candidatus Kapabacteria bacterium]
MKTTILIVMLFSIAASLVSQTVIVPQPLSSWTYLGRSLSLDDTTVFAPRTLNRFIFGWQWAGPMGSINDRLHVNFMQNGWSFSDRRGELYGVSYPQSADTVYMVWSPFGVAGVEFMYSGGDGLHFDPVADTAYGNCNVYHQQQISVTGDRFSILSSRSCSATRAAFCFWRGYSL